MRITPNHPRLRIIAVGCWVIGSWLFIHNGLIEGGQEVRLLSISITIAAMLLLAFGISFWLLGNDRRAGLIFDSKGLMLNLGHSASFVAWEQIAEIGVCRRRVSILALGSRTQLGIRLRDPDAYLQSYEPRLPASKGLLATAVRRVQLLTHHVGSRDGIPTLEDLQRLRAYTGYDVLIPEALLGGHAEALVTMLEAYRYDPLQRRSLASKLA